MKKNVSPVFISYKNGTAVVVSREEWEKEWIRWYKKMIKKNSSDS